MAAPRRPSNLEWEAALASLALAGMRVIVQAVKSCTGGANVSYTVTDAATRRVAVIYIGTGAGDIRFNYNAAAAATSAPVLPNTYLVIDAKKDDTIQFWNTTATANVNLIELA